jgi:two-component sensor histidine kinase
VTPVRPNAADAAAAKARASRSAPRSRQDDHRELDHRLANSLQLAADFLIFEHTRVTDPRARTALIETAERLSAVGQMHRFLAAHHGATGVDLDPFLTELGQLISDSTGLSCQVDAEPVMLNAEAAQQLAIAVNELAMNAAKHAYAWGKRGALHVTCRRRGNNLELIVADDGEGLGKDFAARRTGGLGMSILQAIVRQLHGFLEAVDDHGARFTITFPLPSSGARGPSRSFSPPSPS